MVKGASVVTWACGEGGMCGKRVVCVVKGDMHGKGVHVWQRMVCMAGGMHGRRQPLQWMVCILLECILVSQACVKNSVHGGEVYTPGQTPSLG